MIPLSFYGDCSFKYKPVHNHTTTTGVPGGGGGGGVWAVWGGRGEWSGRGLGRRSAAMYVYVYTCIYTHTYLKDPSGQVKPFLAWRTLGDGIPGLSRVVKPNVAQRDPLPICKLGVVVAMEVLPAGFESVQADPHSSETVAVYFGLEGL